MHSSKTRTIFSQKHNNIIIKNSKPSKIKNKARDKYFVQCIVVFTYTIKWVWSSKTKLLEPPACCNLKLLWVKKYKINTSPKIIWENILNYKTNNKSGLDGLSFQLWRPMKIFMTDQIDNIHSPDDVWWAIV